MSLFKKLKRYIRQIQTVEYSLNTTRQDYVEIYERNRQLEEEIGVRTRELEQSNKALLSLQSVWEMMNSAQPLSSIFDNIIKGLKHGLGYQMCFLLQKKEVGDEQFFQIKAYLENDDMKSINKKLSFPITHYKLNYSDQNDIGDSLKTNKITSSKNVKNMINFLLSSLEENIYQSYEMFTNTKSLITLPLYSGEKPFGVILVFSPRETYSDNEYTFLNLFDYQTELAITIANLFEEIKKQAVSDPLTELYNRRYFLEAIEKEAERANRTQVSFSVISLDLDNLKKINDAYGHSVGDIAIKSVADVLKNNARSIDTAARLGGEEFSVLLPDVDSKTALLVAERIREAIAKTEVEILGHVTASIGVATYFEHSKNIEELMEKADQAMYRAKINGRNQVQLAKSKDDTTWQEIAIQTFIEILSKKHIKLSDNETAEICSKLSQKMVSDAVVKDLIFQTADTIASTYNTENCAGITKLKLSLAVKLAKRLQLSKADTDKLRIAILLYDIGKTLIPGDLLNKKEPLTEDERNIIEQHPMLAVQNILKPISIINDVLPIIEKHHENIDGSGYPQHLAGKNVPLLAQIILLVDSYCSLRQDRPYRVALSHEEAIDVINKDIDKKWNKNIVYDFMQVLCIESPIDDKIAKTSEKE